MRSEREIAGWDLDGEVHAEKVRDRERFLGFVRSVVAGRPAESDSYLVDGDPALADDTHSGPFLANAGSFLNSTYSASVSTPQTVEEGCLSPGICPWPTRVGYRWRETFESGAPAGSQAMPGGVTFFKAASQDLIPVGGEGAIQAALAVWNSDTGSAINVLYGGETSRSSEDGDRINVIEFNDPQGRIPGTWNGSGVIATASITLESPQLINGEYWFVVTDADVIFQNGYTSHEVSLNATLTHEVGHGVGLRHADRNRVDNYLPCDGVTEECSSAAAMTARITGSGFGNVLQV